jgi:hypothetical protein
MCPTLAVSLCGTLATGHHANLESGVLPQPSVWETLGECGRWDQFVSGPRRDLAFVTPRLCWTHHFHTIFINIIFPKMGLHRTACSAASFEANILMMPKFASKTEREAQPRNIILQSALGECRPFILICHVQAWFKLFSSCFPQLCNVGLCHYS